MKVMMVSSCQSFRELIVVLKNSFRVTVSITSRFLIDYSLFNILVSNVSVFTTLQLTGHCQIEWAKTICLWIQHIRWSTVFMASLVAAVQLLSMILLIQSSQLKHLERPSLLVISYLISSLRFIILKFI